MCQDAHAAVQVPRGRDHDFVADALEFQVDRGAGVEQGANRERFDTDRQQRPRHMDLATLAIDSEVQRSATSFCTNKAAAEKWLGASHRRLNRLLVR